MRNDRRRPHLRWIENALGSGACTGNLGLHLQQNTRALCTAREPCASWKDQIGFGTLHTVLQTPLHQCRACTFRLGPRARDVREANRASETRCGNSGPCTCRFRMKSNRESSSNVHKCTANSCVRRPARMSVLSWPLRHCSTKAHHARNVTFLPPERISRVHPSPPSGNNSGNTMIPPT